MTKQSQILPNGLTNNKLHQKYSPQLRFSHYILCGIRTQNTKYMGKNASTLALLSDFLAFFGVFLGLIPTDGWPTACCGEIYSLVWRPFSCADSKFLWAADVNAEPEKYLVCPSECENWQTGMSASHLIYAIRNPELNSGLHSRYLTQSGSSESVRPSQSLSRPSSQVISLPA